MEDEFIVAGVPEAPRGEMFRTLQRCGVEVEWGKSKDTGEYAAKMWRGERRRGRGGSKGGDENLICTNDCADLQLKLSGDAWLKGVKEAWLEGIKGVPTQALSGSAHAISPPFPHSPTLN